MACASARQDMSGQIHQLSVDHSERHSALLEAARRSGVFDVRMVHLHTGDYLIDDEVLIEPKTIGDFVASPIARGLRAERKGRVSSRGGYFGAMQLLADIETLSRVGWRWAGDRS